MMIRGRIRRRDEPASGSPSTTLATTYGKQARCASTTAAEHQFHRRRDGGLGPLVNEDNESLLSRLAAVRRVNRNVTARPRRCRFRARRDDGGLPPA